MKDKVSTIFVSGFLTILYLLVFYLIFTGKSATDFSPFYQSATALSANINPYQMQLKMAANLNPPFFLLLFKPFIYLPSQLAMILWVVLSISLGLIAAHLAFQHIFTSVFFQKHRVKLYLLYLSFYPVLMDISIAQFGQILFFFIMVGYHFYLTHRDKLAGFCWGIIIALKFFPALLFFFVYKQKRMEVLKIMLLTSALSFFIPFLIYGSQIYSHYFTMVENILWYGDSWNASLYGFLFRQLINTRMKGYHNLLPVEMIFFGLFLFLLIIYYRALGPSENKTINHQPFCLSLAMMLFLSPFGWLYYFPMLIFPIILTFFKAFEGQKQRVFAPYYWVFCFFLLYFPQTYVVSRRMLTDIQRFGIFSFQFYGLLLFIFSLLSWRKIYGNKTLDLQEIMNQEQKKNCFFVLAFLIAYGLTVPLNAYLNLYSGRIVISDNPTSMSMSSIIK